MTATQPKKPDFSQVIDFQAPITFNADGVVTKHSAAFASEEQFAEAYREGATTINPAINVKWRAHVICWAAMQGSMIEGDFIECGVHTGIFSRTVCRYLDFGNAHRHRTLYLLDTWEGIPVEQMSEAELLLGFPRHNMAYKDVYAKTVATFAPFPNVKLIRGRVPETLAQVPASTRIAYASIDMNIVEPEIAAGEWIWPRMSLGAFMVLDDYGWPGHHLQLAAWNEFAKRRGTMVMSLPTGQGLLVKQRL